MKENYNESDEAKTREIERLMRELEELRESASSSECGYPSVSNEEYLN